MAEQQSFKFDPSTVSSWPVAVKDTRLSPINFRTTQRAQKNAMRPKPHGVSFHY
jgi:hypothetical protein